jgi:hypothetical protein
MKKSRHVRSFKKPLLRMKRHVLVPVCRVSEFPFILKVLTASSSALMKYIADKRDE